MHQTFFYLSVAECDNSLIFCWTKVKKWQLSSSMVNKDYFMENARLQLLLTRWKAAEN